MSFYAYDYDDEIVYMYMSQLLPAWCHEASKSVVATWAAIVFVVLAVYAPIDFLTFKAVGPLRFESYAAFLNCVMCAYSVYVACKCPHKSHLPPDEYCLGPRPKYQSVLWFLRYVSVCLALTALVWYVVQHEPYDVGHMGLVATNFALCLSVFLLAGGAYLFEHSVWPVGLTLLYVCILGIADAVTGVDTYASVPWTTDLPKAVANATGLVALSFASTALVCLYSRLAVANPCGKSRHPMTANPKRRATVEPAV